MLWATARDDLPSSGAYASTYAAVLEVELARLALAELLAAR